VDERSEGMAALRWQRLSPSLLALYEYLAMFMGLGALALICLFWLPIIVLLLGLPRAKRVRLGRRVIAWSFTAYLGFLRMFCAVRLDCTALDSVSSEKPLILIANHPSLLDAVIILSRFPAGVCVMKSALQKNLLFGPAARFSGYIVNNNPLEMIRQACIELELGAHVLIFPEGTRTRDFPVGPFSGTAALISQRSGVPIQTLILEFSTPYLGKAWPLFRRPLLPLRCTVTLGQRFTAESNTSDLTQELQAYYRRKLNGSTAGPNGGQI
jgi:1-acyl-sn-glycerol-3-phosphate acyltransferase